MNIQTRKTTNQLKTAQWGSKEKYNGKRYNPQKPRKWGLNIYWLCDSMNGYIFSLMFPIMEGPQQRVVHSGLPFTSWTVIHLVQILQSQTSGRGFHAQTDFTPILGQLYSCIKWKSTPLTKLNRTKPGNHEYCPYQMDKKIMFQSLQEKCLVNEYFF